MERFVKKLKPCIENMKRFRSLHYRKKYLCLLKWNRSNNFFFQNHISYFLWINNFIILWIRKLLLFWVDILTIGFCFYGKHYIEVFIINVSTYPTVLKHANRNYWLCYFSSIFTVHIIYSEVDRCHHIQDNLRVISDIFIVVFIIISEISKVVRRPYFQGRRGSSEYENVSMEWDALVQRWKALWVEDLLGERSPRSREGPAGRWKAARCKRPIKSRKTQEEKWAL